MIGRVLARLPLRVLLTVPYVVLVLVLAAVIAMLSLRAGRDAVDTWSDQLLIETVHRISQAVDRHVAGSAAVLEAAFPQGVGAPASIDGDLAALRTRFWLATSVHRDPNNYAYYGDVQGRFFGLWRHSEDEAELRLRTVGEGPRTIYRFTGIGGTLGPGAAETRIFDPRERPWFKAAHGQARHTWTAIYIDFKTAELVATRARRVLDARGEPTGVVATDLSLRQVNNFLQRLALSTNGVAMVVENDGRLIGVSRGPHLRQGADGANQRLNAADSQDRFVASTYRAVQRLVGDGADDQANAPRAAVFEADDGRTVQVGYTRLRDGAGLDWLVMVAVPRDDFVYRVERNFLLTLGLAVLAAVAVVLLGLTVLGLVTGELRSLAGAARRIGEGERVAPPQTGRRDELGELARSFTEMQSRLMTDSLTGLANREALMRQVEERILHRRRSSDSRPFALLFIDFNRFKRINDRFGHTVGDQVLQELAGRLRATVREQDLVARYAGDEFVVLLDALEHRRDAEAVCRQIDAALREPLNALATLAPGEPADGAAIGLAVFPDDGQDIATLVKHADVQMYRAKPR